MTEDTRHLSCTTFCWTLERRDGAGLALTSHDQAIAIDKIRYEPSPGILPAAVVRSAGLEDEPAEVGGAISSDALSSVDLAAGRWRGARARLDARSWSDADAAVVPLVRGEIGEVARQDYSFSVDLLGPAAKLDEAANPLTSPECRASLGDRSCRVDLAGRSLRATVRGWTDNTVELDREIGGEFLAGRLRFTNGANCGLSTAILNTTGRVIRLREPPPFALQGGEIVELHEGCDKRFATCRERFNNAVNFRGEPHLPGNDLLTRYPGS